MLFYSESPTDTFGSVRDRIARFEALQDAKPRKSPPDKYSVDVVVKSGVQMLEQGPDYEDVTQEPLSPSIESEISQAEVKSSSSYNGEDYARKPFHDWDSREKREVEPKFDAVYLAEDIIEGKSAKVTPTIEDYSGTAIGTKLKVIDLEQPDSLRESDSTMPHHLAELNKTTLSSDLGDLRQMKRNNLTANYQCLHLPFPVANSKSLSKSAQNRVKAEQ
ncbi:hypothetical protein KIN20_021874 [Parelaphostrongylus tenuis]|uniref:Uncharacterized protein n=1 Tax=Parelaphostrongylus tenuis TaxID=148309 RepID=A0AAD5QWG1_PARTN|nr:hypothetical protein KIN20_021874 [Parelaphostrongylus tenuis]